MARTWILLRGLIRESRHWESFPGALGRQFPGDRVFALDLPGNGSLCGTKSPTRVGHMVDALRAQLDRRRLEPPFHVVALSLGAMVAVNWLDSCPREVAGAVLISTSVARFSPFWHRLRPASYGPVLRHGLLGRDILERERLILSLTSNLRSAAEREQLARRWAAWAREAGTGRANAWRQLLAALRFRAPRALPGEVPVLVLSGGADRLVDPRCSRALAEGWGLPLRIHPTAGHDLTLDDERWVTARIADWLAAGSGMVLAS